jgi:hypothetical protein
MIGLGEKTLNIEIGQKDQLSDKAQGSFQIAHLLCHKLCILSKILQTQDSLTPLQLPLDVVIEDVMVDLARQFKEPALTFARGSKLRREGRAPYLHILRWLAESEEWSLDLLDAINAHSEHKASIGQVVEKGYLAALLNDPDKRDILAPHFHFETTTSILSVEDRS